MTQRTEASSHRVLTDEANTAWAIGTPVDQWRAATAAGHLLGTDGGDGDTGPSVHMALMAARMLADAPASTSDAALASRTLATPYIAAVAVLQFASGNPLSAVVAAAGPEKVFIGEVNEAADDGAPSVTVPLPEKVPVALVTRSPTSFLVLCRCGALFELAAASPALDAWTARCVTTLAPTTDDRFWWAACAPWSNELLAFDESATITSLSLSRPESAPARIVLGGPSSQWQRGAACTEGLWCAADSRQACEVRVVVVDERQRSVGSSGSSSAASSGSAGSDASSATSGRGFLLVTLVAMGPVRGLPAIDFSHDPRRADMDVSVRVVSVELPRQPAHHPPLGALLEGVASMLTSGDGGLATLVLASALAPELVMITVNLREHEEEYSALRHGGVASTPHRARDGSGTMTVSQLPTANAMYATATAWVPPHTRHPQWHARRTWRAGMPPARLPATAHVTAVATGHESFEIAIHPVEPGRRQQ